MKKMLLSSVIMLFISFSVKACDICGSGSGSGYTGILPDFYKCIAGVRHRYNDLRTHLGAGGNTTYLTSNEQYHTLEIWGGWAISNKVRIMATLPYSINVKTKQGITTSKNGISDISFSGYYKLLDKETTVFKTRRLKQIFWMGATVKLPTGAYNPEDKSITNQNTNLFQLGTASVDYSLAAIYDVRVQNTGLNISAAYKMNSSNKYHYRYGNKMNISTQVYHRFTLGNLVIAPNTGLQFETAQQDTDHHFKAELSGGNTLLGTVGIEGNLGKMAIGANFQTALSQHLANGFVKAGNRTMLHVSFAL